MTLNDFNSRGVQRESFIFNLIHLDEVIRNVDSLARKGPAIIKDGAIGATARFPILRL